MCNLYRRLSIYLSYHVSVHLANWFQRGRFYRNRLIRNKNCLWRQCLLMDQDKMCNLYRGSSIDASYHVSVHLAKQFQRRFFFKSTNQKQELPVASMFVNRSREIGQSLQRTFHRCFPPSFSSYGQAVSEEKVFQKSSNEKQVLPMAAMFVNRTG